MALASSRRIATRRSLRPLGELADLVRDSVVPARDDPAPYIALEHINSGDIAVTAMGQARDARSAKFAFGPGDVLYAKLRPYLDKAVLATQAGLASTELLVLRARGGVDPTFLAYTMHSPPVLAHAKATTGGVNLPRTSWKALRDVYVHAPSIDEQQRVASLLSAVWLANQARATSFASAVAMRTSLLHHIFGGGYSASASWEYNRLADVAEIVYGIQAAVASPSCCKSVAVKATA